MCATPAARSARDQRGGVVADAVAHHDRRRRTAVDVDADARQPALRRPGVAPPPAPGARPSATRRPSDAARDALRPAPRARRVGNASASPLLVRRRARARRPAGGRTAGPATRRAAAPRRADAVDGRRSRTTRGVPSVSVPVLSSSTLRTRAEPLDHAGALDDDARRARRARRPRPARSAPRGSAGTASRRRRRPARAAASPLTRPGRAGDDQRDGQEQRRVAIGHARERRAVGLRLRDELDERGVGALRRRPQRAQVERRAGVGDAAAHRRAARVGRPAAARRSAPPRRRTAVAETHLPSTGTTSPCRTTQHVAGHDRRRPRPPRARSPRRTCADRGARCQQRGQLPARAAVGRRLERVAAGEHQRDHRAGEVLAQRQRAGHRDQRDRVDADAPVRAASRAPTRPAARAARRRSPPRRRRGVVVAEGRQHQARDDPRQRGAGGDRVRPAAHER